MTAPCVFCLLFNAFFKRVHCETDAIPVSINLRKCKPTSSTHHGEQGM